MAFSFLERVVKKHSRDYVTLEIWSDDYPKRRDLAGFRSYVDHVLRSLRESYPYMDIYSVKRSSELEIHHSILLALHNIKFCGYLVRLAPNLNLSKLKERCMQLELDSDGKRIADIDIYYKKEKISRKTINSTDEYASADKTPGL